MQPYRGRDPSGAEVTLGTQQQVIVRLTNSRELQQSVTNGAGQLASPYYDSPELSKGKQVKMPQESCEDPLIDKIDLLALLNDVNKPSPPQVPAKALETK